MKVRKEVSNMGQAEQSGGRIRAGTKIRAYLDTDQEIVSGTVESLRDGWLTLADAKNDHDKYTRHFTVNVPHILYFVLIAEDEIIKC